MEFWLNFLIVCGRLLNDPCINAVWISFGCSTKCFYLFRSLSLSHSFFSRLCISVLVSVSSPVGIEFGKSMFEQNGIEAWEAKNNLMLNYDICKMNCELFQRLNVGKRKKWNVFSSCQKRNVKLNRTDRDRDRECWNKVFADVGQF